MMRKNILLLLLIFMITFSFNEVFALCSTHSPVYWSHCESCRQDYCARCGHSCGSGCNGYHNYPTCSTCGGVTSRYCSSCGYGPTSLGSDCTCGSGGDSGGGTIGGGTSGHTCTYTNYEGTTATCTSSGYDTYSCSYTSSAYISGRYIVLSSCDNTTRSYRSALGHSFTRTCSQAHCGRPTCSRCGAHQTSCGGGHIEPTQYSSNSTQHWKKCTYSGCTHYYVAETNHVDTSPTNGVCDVCGYNMDTTPPTILVSPTSATSCKSKSITITASDNTGGIGLATTNSYQYYLSSNNNSLTGGAWTTYTSGVSYTIGTEKNGTYYLFVKRVSDKANNTSVGLSNICHTYLETSVFEIPF